MNFKKGALIDKLSKTITIYRKYETINEIGSSNTEYRYHDTRQAYITKNENSGSRSDIANEYGEVSTYTLQTTNTFILGAQIRINDLISTAYNAKEIFFRVNEIDQNVAGVFIEGEMKISEVENLAYKLVR